MRIRDPGLLRLLHFEYDECAVCGTPHRIHLHHVLFRSHGGDDVRANIAPLCQHDHDGYHLNRGDVRERLANHIQAHRPDTVEYLVEKLGEGGYERWFTIHTCG